AQPLAEIIWLTDGIDTGRSQAFLTQLKEAVGNHALTVYDGGTPPVLALTGATNNSGGFNAQVIRAEPGPAQVGRVRALDTRG
uniref:hypothetical protein n=1 Tax=Serratia marcescens TaxID=615 RepID=UPI0013DA6CA2